MSSRPVPARTPLSVRFLIYYAVSYLLLIGALGWFVDRQVRETLIADLEFGLQAYAELARLSMPEDPGLLDGWASEVFSKSGLRVSLIGADGFVVVDSHTDPTVLENHSTRPEVVAALAGEVGISSRRSESTGFAQHYLALPIDATGFILRVSVSDASVVERLTPIRNRVIWTSLLVGLIGVAVVAVLARRLARPIERIRDTTLSIAEGNLDLRPMRSGVREIDDLGLSISQLADDLSRRLEQSELANETLAVVLGAIPQGTVLIGASEDVIYANSTARHLLGPIPDHLSGMTPHPLQTAVRLCLKTGQQQDVVLPQGAPERLIRAVVTPFSGDQRTLLVLVDVTDRERVASVRRDFVANASHELKTPVASIISAAEALSTAVQRNDPAATTFADGIEKSARQLDRLVSDLLDLSRLEREAPQLEPVALDDLLRAVVARFEGAASGAGVVLSISSTPTHVLGNPRDLSIAFGNLVENAINYTPSGGTVEVQMVLDEEEVVVEVSDTGLGIPTRDLERIFERFYRVDAARSRETGGTGLGLSIAKHSIESHRGSIEARSELGRGSTFVVRLARLIGPDVYSPE